MLKQPPLKKTSQSVVDPSTVKGADQPVADRSKPADRNKSHLDAPTATLFLPENAGQPKVNEKPAKKWAKKLLGLSKRKVAVALGLLGASSGLAFTQVAPRSLQAAIIPEPASAPLRRDNDPPTEPVLETQDLFLTNEIFYRKIEAIAQVPRTSNANPAPKGSPAKAATAASPAADQAAAAKAAAAQAEQVKAAAPPAPQLAAAPLTGTTIDTVLEMRVALAKDVSAIAFATSGSGSISDMDGNIIKSLPAETSALAEISSGIVVNGQPMPNDFWIYPEEGGYVAVGSSWYRGRVRIALRDDGLIAVNHVFLGDYLYSVVGSEMSPDWAIESLKAQAIAARSYALTHNINPANEGYYDLDNTPQYQAYTGIAREANTTQLAVQSTAGEFISHEGGIVESLYAASQAIVDDAHDGSGMSQLGARDLADQGYSYTEILGHYYPGTALGRISTDAE
jgi:stage II sporulation protein D